MRIRSTGSTFTEKLNDDLKRSVELKRNGTDTLRLSPDELVSILIENPLFLVREVTSVVDKTIRKRSSLKNMVPAAYCTRAILAGHLWREIIQPHTSTNEIDEIKARWIERMHPYISKSVDEIVPSEDGNFKIIIKNFKGGTDEHSTIPEDFRGKWFKTFIHEGENALTSVEDIAQRIKGHLLVQEKTITNEDRRKNKSPTGMGFIERRLIDLTSSTHDPRDTSKQSQHRGWQNSDAHRTYFDPDIAKILYEEIEQYDKLADPILTKFSGERLQYHYAGLKPKTEQLPVELKKQIHETHNTTRRHYAKLLKSNKFRLLWEKRRSLYEENLIATPQNEEDKKRHEKQKDIRAKAHADVMQLFPKNFEHFITRQDAKAANQDYSRYIRIGKLLVHASDIPVIEDRSNEALNTTFKDNLIHFSTSDGQAEIKRNETFTRVFRTAIGLSHRTLSTLVTPNPKQPPYSSQTKRNKTVIDTDIAASAVMQMAYDENNFNSSHFNQQVSLIFGTQKVKDLLVDDWTNETAQSRAEIMGLNGKADDQRQVGKQLTKIMASVRNRTVHFSTLPRVVDLFTTQMPKEMENKSPAAFSTLLKYDQKMQAFVWAQDLNRLKVHVYANSSQMDGILKAVVAQPTGDEVPAPRFKAVMNRLKQLNENEEAPLSGIPASLAELEIAQASNNTDADQEAKDQEKLTRQLNNFKAGISRILYSSGFAAWLENEDGKQQLKQVLRQLTDYKKTRTEEYHKSRGKTKIDVEDLLSKLGIDPSWSLKDVFVHLTKHTAREEGLNKSYGVAKSKQKLVANRLEEFRQELYGHMFGNYLASNKFEWIYEATERSEQDALSEKKEASEIAALLTHEKQYKHRHELLYAWLYTVPPEDISRLRHQIKKTSTLDSKANTESNSDVRNALNEMDELMGLYTAVQGAGFNGREHLIADGKSASESISLINETCADIDLDLESYADENEEASYAGVRRGLRQILRYGNHTLMENIFQKHKVSNGEVTRHSYWKKYPTENFQKAALGLRKQVFDGVKKLRKMRNPDDELKAQLSQSIFANAKQCKINTSEARYMDFHARAIRLVEHAKAHEIFMRIIGRLVDYSALWERDMYFLWLGLYYEQQTEKGDGIIKLVNTKGGKYHPNSPAIAINGPEGEIPLWNKAEAFCLPTFMELATHLDHKRQLVQRRVESREEVYREIKDGVFEWVINQNPRDIAANEAKDEDNKKKKPMPFPIHDKKPRTIRNDFAHYNVLANMMHGEYDERRNEFKKSAPKWSLTYKVNAIRSLFFYDDKLQKSVSGSIKRILEREGLDINWTMNEHRLRHARVDPIMETHLADIFVEKRGDLSFEIPRHTPRLVSMVQAMFQFDDGGARTLVTVGKAKKAIGGLRYKSPAIRGEEKICKKLRDLDYPSLEKD